MAKTLSIEEVRQMEEEQKQASEVDTLSSLLSGFTISAPKPLPSLPCLSSIPFTLFPYQLQGIQWMMEQEEKVKGGILADDMGLGKTIQSIGLILAHPAVDQSILIITTLSTYHQWIDALSTQCNSSYPIVGYYGAKRSLPECHPSIIVTTYQTVVKDERLPTLHYHRIMLDEAHMIRNANTKTAKAIFQLKATYRWCLTGTPIQNHIDDLYALIRFLRYHPYRLRSIWLQNVLKLITSRTPNQRMQGRRNLMGILSDLMLRREKKGVLKDSLPTCHQETLFLQPTVIDIMAYDKVASYVKTYHDQGFQLIQLMRLRQVCAHPWILAMMDCIQYEMKSEEIDREIMTGSFQLLATHPICMICNDDTYHKDRIRYPCKHVKCMECEEESVCRECGEKVGKGKVEGKKGKNRLLEDSFEGKVTLGAKLTYLADHFKGMKTGEKTVLFSQFQSHLDVLEKFLVERGIGYQRLDGGMKQTDREKAIKLFQGVGHDVFLISLKAGGTGLNLQCAKHVVLMDCWWNGAVEDQAIDRVYRLGVAHEVTVKRLIIRGTVEEKVYQLQMRKRKQTEKVFQLGKIMQSDRARMTKEDIQWVLKDVLG